MPKGRRSSNRRPPALATATNRAIRRDTEFLADPTPSASLQSTDDDSSPSNVPASSYVPYAQRHPQSNPRAPPSTRPHPARFPHRYPKPPLAEPNDRHEESQSSGYDSVDSDNFPLDDDRGDRDMFYMNEAIPPQLRNSLTMLDAPNITKNKRKSVSFYTPKVEKKEQKENNGKTSGRGRMGDRGSKRMSFAGDMLRDYASSSTSSASSRLREALPDGQIELEVHRFVLEGNNASVRKKAPFGAWLKKNGPCKAVRVEATPAQMSLTCLFAPNEMSSASFEDPYEPTEPITYVPEEIDKDTIVYQDSPFEIGVLGMSVSAKDFTLTSSNNNELLMFSLHQDPEDETGEGDALPFVHYDPTKDSGHNGTAPDTFIPIPASKSLLMVSDGKRDNSLRRSVNVQFKLLELDRVDESMQISLSGIEELGNHISQFSKAAPLLGLLSPALHLASSLSRRALESYAKPDRIITTDMNFLLMKRPSRKKQSNKNGIELELRSGEYLRYGYYFFLEKPVDAKLYASIRTFPHVQLLMRRMDKLSRNEKRYFPLTGVSYLVVRVTPRISSLHATRLPIRMSHVQQLEDLMKSSVNLGGEPDAKYVVKMLASLASDLGIIKETEDVEEEDEEEERREGNGGDQENGNERVGRRRRERRMEGNEGQTNTSGGGDSASS